MKLFIVTIPGIGSKEPNYSAGLKKDLRAHFFNTPLYDQFEIIEALPFFEKKIDENQQALFERLGKKNNLGGIMSPRKFVLEAFGDGVTYEHAADSKDSAYRKAHEHLAAIFSNVQKKMLANPGSKLVVVASSLGAHMFSNHLYDVQHEKGIFMGQAATDQEKLENLSHLATIGCNIPLFLSGLTEEQIVAIRKPNNPDFTWDNYFDPDDVLGWPLKQLSDSYSKLVVDHEINTGMYVGSHLRYWDDNEFTVPFARKCLKLFKY